MRTTFLLAVSSLVFTLAASGAPLEIAEVSAPSINCIFDADCHITVNDSTAPITLPAASGQGFLQSRTAPPGQAGTPGAGLTPYEYRIDLRQVAGLTALPCITELSLDFGALTPLDYDGDGHAEDVFVVTGGGLGSVGLASADKVGDRITFRFQPAVCAGSHPGGGESTFFFGLAGQGPPQPVTAQAVVSLGGTLDLAARSPGGTGGGGAGPAPTASGLCFPGAPITADAPICTCLRDRVLRELRCALLLPDLVLVRRTPLPIPPGQPFAVRWTFAPLDNFQGSVVVEDGLAPGFARPQGPQRLVFEAGGGQGRSVTREYRLTAPRAKGALSVPGRITVEPRGGKAESFQVLLPIGPLPWPDLGDVVSEPLPSPPAHPDFGPGPCGHAASRLWQEHVERFGGTPFGLSYAEYTDLKTRAERCRRAMPDYSGLCGGAAEQAWADCFLEGGRSCSAAASQAIERCRRVVLDGPLRGILGGLRDDLIHLEGP